MEEKKELSLIEKYLTFWIFLAIILGVTLGYTYPDVSNIIAAMSIGTTSVPIAIGLILMMYPPLAKVRYEEMGKVFHDLKLLVFSLTQNWIVGPLLMFLLAIFLLRDMPEFMIGVILVGLARCIAMVIVWNELAEGDRELAVGLVAFNAIFQILFYAFYIYIFITLALTKIEFFGRVEADIGIAEAAKTVFIYLGIPFIGGFVTRYAVFKLKSKEWFEMVLSPKIGLITPIALLLTIVIMFSLKGEYIVELPYKVLRVAIPLTLYFLIMWFTTFFIAYKFRVNYNKATAVSFTAASNDFELAIAVSIAIWGIHSDQAFATVIGPLIEVPVLISLVNVALKLKKRFYGV
ncbi:MAG: ACR3 family arsenite efflux transporter [Archaeoglobaceae archaeon]|nr:ACR3 family arsenite efflux transporter [Archaeoglobaceae archaeon]MDW7989886.1 ACR3 family arsenite efflux transporter [Archaeoglobaceae archaeon]